MQNDQNWEPRQRRGDGGKDQGGQKRSLENVFTRRRGVPERNWGKQKKRKSGGLGWGARGNWEGEREA